MVSAIEVWKLPIFDSWPDLNYPGHYLCLKLLLAFSAPDKNMKAAEKGVWTSADVIH